jgi:hypothetical protein
MLLSPPTPEPDALPEKNARYYRSFEAPRATRSSLRSGQPTPATRSTKRDDRVTLKLEDTDPSQIYTSERPVSYTEGVQPVSPTKEIKLQPVRGRDLPKNPLR